LSGKEHLTHYSNKLIPEKRQVLEFDCKCEIKCASVFSNDQKIDLFKRYYSLKSHAEKYLFLKNLVIPNNNKVLKRKKFDYYIETFDNVNKV